MTQGYAVDAGGQNEFGRWRLAVGRVFGQTHADLIIEDLDVKTTGGTIDEIKVTVRNQGDAPAGPSFLKVAPSSDMFISGDDHPVAQVSTPGVVSSTALLFTKCFAAPRTQPPP